MKRTENGVNLSNQEADAVIEVLDVATELVDELHKSIVETNESEYTAAQAESELRDSIDTVKTILKDSTDEELAKISTRTTNTDIHELIDAFVKIEDDVTDTTSATNILLTVKKDNWVDSTDRLVEQEIFIDPSYNINVPGSHIVSAVNESDNELFAKMNLVELYDHSIVLICGKDVNIDRDIDFIYTIPASN